MTTRNRFRSLAVTVLVASLALAGGRARAATISHFDGQFSSGPGGPNIGISTAEPGMDYAEGTGQNIFYLSFGTVSSTRDPSVQWNGLAINDLTVDVSAFTANNPFGSVTAFGIVDSRLLQVNSTVAPHADFTMAATARITSNQENHATIQIGVTLRDSSDPNGDDLSPYIIGGTFTIDIDNIQIRQPRTDGITDGRVFFPVNPDEQVTVNWSIDASYGNWSINPVPEPSSAVSMLIGAGLLAL